MIHVFCIFFIKHLLGSWKPLLRRLSHVSILLYVLHSFYDIQTNFNPIYPPDIPSQIPKKLVFVSHHTPPNVWCSLMLWWPLLYPFLNLFVFHIFFFNNLLQTPLSCIALHKFLFIKALLKLSVSFIPQLLSFSNLEGVFRLTKWIFLWRPGLIQWEPRDDGVNSF